MGRLKRTAPVLCQTVNKPSAWFLGVLVEQSTDEEQNDEDEDKTKTEDGGRRTDTSRQIFVI